METVSTTIPRVLLLVAGEHAVDGGLNDEQLLPVLLVQLELGGGGGEAGGGGGRAAARSAEKRNIRFDQMKNKNRLNSTTCGEELQKIFKDWQSFKGLCQKEQKNHRF